MGTPHISASKGEIAESVLLPGDPLRAKYIAENFLTEPKLFNEVRGMLGYTGTYGGREVSVMGTGMGIPSLSIYVSELLEEYGVKKLIRVGTCGACRPEIKLRDIILAAGCCTDNAFLDRVFPGDFALLADFGLLNAAYEKARDSGLRVFAGLLKSVDMFYSEPAPGDDYWIKYGVLGLEMEGAGLYALAAKHGAGALTMASVSDTLYDKKELSGAERERTLDEMIKLALGTLTES